MGDSEVSVGPKRPRKTNYSQLEIEKLTDEVAEKSGVLNASFSSTVTNKMKTGIWEKIANKMNAVSSADRTASDVRKKWNELKCQTCKKAQAQKREMVKTGGGPAPSAMTALEERVISLIPKCQVDGIDGALETGGFGGDELIVELEGEKGTANAEEEAVTAHSQNPSLPEDCTVPKAPTEMVKSEAGTRQRSTNLSTSIVEIEGHKLGEMKNFFSSVNYKLDRLLELESRRLTLEERRLSMEEEKLKLINFQFNQSSLSNSSVSTAMSVSPIIKLFEYVD